MKKLLAGLLTLIFLSACSNKNDDSDVISQRYIHKYGFEVSEKEWLERNSDGQIVTAFQDGSSLARSYKNGALHGPTTLTFPKSQTIAEKQEYSEGVLLKKTFYAFSGLPRREETFEKGKTTITVWTRKGVPLSIEEYLDGKLINGKYFTSSNVLEASITGGNGTRIKRDENGQLLNQEKFQKGEMVQRTAFHPSGKAETISYFSNYKLNGLQKTFAANGALTRTANWIDGKQHGKEIGYRNGQKYLEVPYVNGLKHGLETEYLNSMLVREVPWKDGEKHGMQRICAKDFTDIQWFYNGEAVELDRYRKLQARDAMMAELEKSKGLIDLEKKNVR